MKFTFELEDDWFEDGSLQQELVTSIKFGAVAEVKKSIDDKVVMEVTQQVKDAVDSRLKFVIENKVSELIDSGVIVRNNKEISIVEHIKNEFERHSGWSRPDEKIQIVAKKFGEELKAQYNNIFAAKIVDNMKHQGLLRDDVVKLLLED